MLRRQQTGLADEIAAFDGSHAKIWAESRSLSLSFPAYLSRIASRPASDAFRRNIIRLALSFSLDYNGRTSELAETMAG